MLLLIYFYIQVRFLLYIKDLIYIYIYEVIFKRYLISQNQLKLICQNQP